MVIVQERSRRKASGGRYKSSVIKRKHSFGRKPTHTKLAEHKNETIRTKGGSTKTKLIQSNTANVVGKDKTTKTKIKAVLENPANRHFVRSNIITKGAIIDTELGKARVTSRPGQDGSIDAVLL